MNPTSARESHSPPDQILLLHLSDLHFGPYSRFAGKDPKDLGQRFGREVQDERARQGIEPTVGLIVVSGDVAETADEEEYGLAAAFFGGLAGMLGLDRRRFVFAPGNHDVSWAGCKVAFAMKEYKKWDERSFRRKLDQQRFQRFEEFLEEFYGEHRTKLGRELANGAFVYDFHDLKLSVASLNSCERETHTTHGGLISEAQAQSVMDYWQQARLARWLKAMVLHHNPVSAVPDSVKESAEKLKKLVCEGSIEPEVIDHYLSDAVGLDGFIHLRQIAMQCQVQVILHGHQHARAGDPWLWAKDGQTYVLSAGSWGVGSGGRPGEHPNSVQMELLDLGSMRLRVWTLNYDPLAQSPGSVTMGAFRARSGEDPDYDQPLYPPEGFDKGRPAAPRRPTAPDTGAFLREYRLRLSGLYSRWDLRPVGVTQPGGGARPIAATLEDMYLPLRLGEGYDLRELGKGSEVSPPTLLNRDRPLAVRGPAGAGKTTWMRWTFRELLENEGAFPIMIELRRLARVWQEVKSSERSLEKYIENWVIEYVGEGWTVKLRDVLDDPAGPRPVLLVDGWDELGELGEDLRDKLLGLMRRYDRTLVVASSRPYGQGQPSHSEGFDVLDIQPLSDPEVKDLGERFLLHCYPDERRTVEDQMQEFVGALERSDEARDLSRTALLLTMMLFISRSSPLPDKRHKLYGQCIDNLLTALPDQKQAEGAQLLQSQWRPDDGSERKRVVANLAYEMQFQGQETSRARSVAVKSWDDMATLLPERWQRDHRLGFLGWLAGPAGLLVDRADGNLQFGHLSFQEFLAAWHLNATVEEKDKRNDSFIARMKDHNSWETLRLWASLIDEPNPARVEPVLKALIGTDDHIGHTLAGALLADGLGSETVMEEWLALLIDLLPLSGYLQSSEPARIWSGSRQEKRRDRIHQALGQSASDRNWIEWLRCDAWSGEAGLKGQFPLPRSGTTSRVVIEALHGHRMTEPVFAAGRVLCGGFPFWPPGGETAALLHLWPSERRLAGLSLQSLADLGAGDVALRAVAATCLRAWSEDARARYLARYLARDLASDWARDLARDLARDWGLESEIRLADDYSFIELLSLGRVAGRSFLAVQQPGIESSQEWRLLTVACQASLVSAGESSMLKKALASYQGDPLWPALARHLVRRTTPEDRALLEDIARNPDQRDPPLSWGLKYIVRGDIMLDGGTVVTLDELSDDLGMERLPYLDDMPDEWVDGDAS